jgi:hypothetical protein
MTITDHSLLDDVLPESDVSAVYSIRIKARPEIIYQSMENGIPVGSITKLLMKLRTLPQLFQRKTQRMGADPFYRLKQEKNREIVLGLAGQFWKPTSKIIPIHSLEEFLNFQRDGYCKAAMNMKIVQKTERESVLITETRVLCYGSAKRHFKNYWRLVGPFSGLIRLEMLRKIRKRAESSPQKV